MSGPTYERPAVPRGKTPKRQVAPPWKRPREAEAMYPYLDEDGNTLFVVMRYADKKFAQARPVDGMWEWSLNGTRRVLFDLPRVVAAVREEREVWVTEGEKDAIAIWSTPGRPVATTNPMGAGKWKAEYSETLRGAHVVIWSDNDEAGRAHGDAVARALEGVAADVRRVEAKEGKDAADHFAAGLGLQDAVSVELVTHPTLDEAEAELAEKEGLVLEEPGNPMPTAREFVRLFHTRDDTLLLRSWRGDFYIYNGVCWPEQNTRKLDARLYEWLETARYWKTIGKAEKLVPWAPTRHKVADLLGALHAVTHKDSDPAPPAWLEDGGPFPAGETVVLQNGLLHMPTRTFIEHTPNLFVQHSLAFDYDPEAPEPERWTQFMRELWDDDDESIATLGEIMGYVLGGDTKQQKLFMMVGPKRSGKGTIARVLEGLFGAHNVAAPTLSGLTQDFGLSPLIGKPLAVVSDARLGTRADSMIAVERLLSISGEDALSVNRKYKEHWTGTLPTRFLILTNELPQLSDSSGALVSRFVMLTLTKDFYGREDPTLTRKLLAEAPSIFNWALAGLDRLNERGYFVQPQAAEDARRQLEDMSSPVSAFLRERCQRGPAFEIGKDELFYAWREWCDLEGRPPGTAATFGRDLTAAAPGVRAARPGQRGDRRRVYRGVRLREGQQQL